MAVILSTRVILRETRLSERVLLENVKVFSVKCILKGRITSSNTVTLECLGLVI